MKAKRRFVAWLLGLVMLLGPGAGALALSGYVLEDEALDTLESGLREAYFSGEMQSIELSEAQSLLFDGREVDRLLPNMWFVLGGSPDFEEDATFLSDMIGSIIASAQTLQEQFPDAFLFHTALAEAHEAAGLRYAVAETDLWLWAESMGVMLAPFFLYEESTGALVGDPYLIQVAIEALEEGHALHYIVYNDPEAVLRYLEHVEVDGAAGVFHAGLASWYVSTQAQPGEIDQLLQAQPSPAPEGQPGASIDEPDVPQAGPAPVPIGKAGIIVKSANIRATPSEDARVVAYAHAEEVYPVLSVDKASGWYELLLETGETGFISPKLVEMLLP